MLIEVIIIMSRLYKMYKEMQISVFPRQMLTNHTFPCRVFSYTYLAMAEQTLELPLDVIKASPGFSFDIGKKF